MKLKIDNVKLIAVTVLFVIVCSYLLLRRSNKEMFSLLGPDYNTSRKNKSDIFDNQKAMSDNILKQHYQRGRPLLITEDDVNNTLNDYYKKSRFN